MQSKTKDLQAELSYLRDNLVEGIRQGKTALVKDGLEMYKTLISAFIDKLKQFGSPYDRKRAIQELSAIEGGWSEIAWIKDDLHETIDVSLNTKNIHVIRDVLYFPIHLASMAFIERDYYIFHQFINWVPYYYIKSLSIRDSKIRDFIMDRCWRWLKEISDFIISDDLKRISNDEEIEKAHEFADGVILVFNQLLKSAYDNRELNHFKTFVHRMESLFEYYKEFVRESKPEDIRWRLENQHLSYEEKDALEKELKLRKKHVCVLEEIELKKKIVLYGINAWILRHYDDGKLKIEEFKKWHESIPSFGDLKEIWELFLKAEEDETQHELGWDWWELDEHPEGKVIWVSFDQSLRLLFCIKCLEILKAMTPAQREQATIPHSSAILYLAESEDSPFRQVLKKIKEEDEKWRPIIGDKGVDAIPAFGEILTKAVKAQKEKEVENLIKAPLCGERIEEVKKDILKEWKNNAAIRHIVQNYGTYKYCLTPPEGMAFFGLNVIDTKEVYVKESRISALGWGEHYGRSLAKGENEFVLEKILSGLPSFRSQPIPDKEIAETTDEVLSKLKNAGYNPVILILNAWFALRVFETMDEFDLPDEREKDLKLVGYYKRNPLFSFNYRGKPLLIVADVKKLGVWQQFKPKQLLDEEEYISIDDQDIFSFCITSFTKESALEFIQKQSQFRQDKDGHKRPKEEMVTELLQRVRLRIVEQFDFEVIDRNAGYKISVSK